VDLDQYMNMQFVTSHDVDGLVTMTPEESRQESQCTRETIEERERKREAKQQE
jgi:hypothetical protein